MYQERERERVRVRKVVHKEKLKEKEEEEEQKERDRVRRAKLKEKEEQEEKEKVKLRKEEEQEEKEKAKLRKEEEQKKEKALREKAEAESKQSLGRKPLITAPKPNLYHQTLNTAKESAEEKSKVTTEMEAPPRFKNRVTVFGDSIIRDERPSTSRKVSNAQTQREGGNSSVITNTIQQGGGGQREKDPHVQVRERFNLFRDSLLDSSLDGSKYSMDNKPIHVCKNYERQTEEKNDGKNPNVITHTIKKDFEEGEKEKGPHVKVREKFNLFRDSIKDFSWHSTTDSKQSIENKPPPKKENTAEGQKSATEKISTQEENSEKTESKSTLLDRGFNKVFGNPAQKQEKHSTSSTEVKKHVEKKKDGMVSHTIVHTHFHTHNNHIIQYKPEEPKKVEVTLRTYKDLKNNSAQSTINSSSSKPASNEYDLQLQARKCKELEIQFKDDEARKGKRKEKKSRLQRAWACCSGCCLQSAECL